MNKAKCTYCGEITENPVAVAKEMKIPICIECKDGPIRPRQNTQFNHGLAD